MRLSIVLGLMALSACNYATAPAAKPQDALTTTSAPASELSSPVDSLVNRAWRLSASATELAQPGRIRIFLSDGVYLQGACWEPFRLSTWKTTGPDSISWNEDGIEIPATISVADDAVIITMQLQNEARSERLSRMEAPFVCPDFPK